MRGPTGAPAGHRQGADPCRRAQTVGVVIDGRVVASPIANSLLHSALSGVIATSEGEPTNAILGFASMLVKIISEYGVKPTLVVWDAGMSGRKEVYGEYKAQRDSKPDLLPSSGRTCSRSWTRSATRTSASRATRPTT